MTECPDLKVVFFAGGVGQRLWPLSRRNTPKQFTPLIGSTSSFRLAVERAKTIAPASGMYVGTNKAYFEALCRQAPEIPPANFFLEPVRRDVAAAVALAFFSIEKDGARGPVLFQWTDNYVKDGGALLESIASAYQLVKADPERLVFIGETPRFANENLGWIELGEECGRVGNTPYYPIRSWQYRPPKQRCQEMFASGGYVWNAGFFVTSVEFMTSAFRRLAPDISQAVEEIVSYRGTPREQEKIDELYPNLPALHFDDAILVRLPERNTVVLRTVLGWSDPGSLYALKEALQESPEETVHRGAVLAVETKDSLIYNEDPKKLVATMGLEGIVVVETPDVTLVIHKDSVRHIGKLLDELAAKGRADLL